MNTSRMLGERLVWQRPEHMLPPEALETVLNNTPLWWPHSLLGSEAAAFPGKVNRAHVVRVHHEPLKGGVSGAHLERLLLDVTLEGPAGLQPMALPLIFKR